MSGETRPPDASPEEMDRMDKKATGLYDKFIVTRTDGQSATGQKHSGCEYFVLDLDHDPHARLALHAYADSCRHDYPKLAEDLTIKAMTKAFGR